MSFFIAKKAFARYFFPILITALGILLLFTTLGQYFETQRIVATYKNAEQPTILPIIAAFFIVLAGVLYFLISAGRLNTLLADARQKKLFNSFLLLLVFGMAYLNYYIIRVSMDEASLREKRKYLVTNRLLDLQLAQQLYKREQKQFATNFEELIGFLKTAQEQSLIKIELKELPKELDTLSETKQLEQGYIRYDTVSMSLLERYFTSLAATRERKTKKRPDFILDSITYSPLSASTSSPKAQQFIFKHTINKDFITQKETVLFEILDPTPLLGSEPDTLKIGSLIENTANGNWAEK